MDERLESLRKYNTWNGNNIADGLDRTLYTDKIMRFVGSREVKVLTGQRRVGKSYLLRQCAMRLIDSGVACNSILFINKELEDYAFLVNHTDLNELVALFRREMCPEGKVYVFVDEVQEIEGWERAVNSLSQNYAEACELFVSGSNAKMLSGELATLLSGRYVCFEVGPFSYPEYLALHGKTGNRAAYMDYMREGGMPVLHSLPDGEVRRQYMSSLKDTIMLKDIVARHNVRDVRLLDQLFSYLVNNIGKLTSANNVCKTLNSMGRKVSYETVTNYLDFLCEPFLFHKAERIDLAGKSILEGACKYYVNDLSFGNYLYSGYRGGIGYQLENNVYLELCRMGYEVYVGKMRDVEVDFVAQKGDHRIYLQVAYSIEDEETYHREYQPLRALQDNYEKYVVTLDDIKRPSDAGIQHLLLWDDRTWESRIENFTN